MTSEEIKKVLALHKKWLNDEDSGERANLSEADLRGAALSWADLSRAVLSEAGLSGADLSWADLDFSCPPLLYGGSDFKCDTKLNEVKVSDMDNVLEESNMIDNKVNQSVD